MVRFRCLRTAPAVAFPLVEFVVSSPASAADDGPARSLRTSTSEALVDGFIGALPD
jgi:hypothetical protein